MTGESDKTPYSVDKIGFVPTFVSVPVPWKEGALVMKMVFNIWRPPAPGELKHLMNYLPDMQNFALHFLLSER